MSAIMVNLYMGQTGLVNCFEYREFIKRLVPEQYHEKVFYENAVRVYGLV